MTNRHPRLTNLLVACAVIVVLSGCTALRTSPTFAAALCPKLPHSVTLLVEGKPHLPGSRLLQRWDIHDDPAWKMAASKLPQLLRRELQKLNVPTDARLLLRQYPTPNNRLVDANFERWVRPVNCLEARLYEAQNQRMRVLEQSTEFAAFVLRSPNASTVRIYNWTRNEDGIGNVGSILAYVEPDVRAGWTLTSIIHNHNFHPSAQHVNGIVAPSGPDAGLFKALSASFGLKGAIITNGLQSVDLSGTDFVAFGDNE